MRIQAHWGCVSLLGVPGASRDQEQVMDVPKAVTHRRRINPSSWPASSIGSHGGHPARCPHLLGVDFSGPTDLQRPRLPSPPIRRSWRVAIATPCASGWLRAESTSGRRSHTRQWDRGNRHGRRRNGGDSMRPTRRGAKRWNTTQKDHRGNWKASRRDDFVLPAARGECDPPSDTLHARSAPNPKADDKAMAQTANAANCVVVCVM